MKNQLLCLNPKKVMMLYSDGTPRELIDLPENYATFKYGWVTTSHKSQGRTAENVVVAAQALDRKAFYVALSRGRKIKRPAIHVWDQSGNPLAVYPLRDVKKIVTVTVEVDKVKIIGTDKQEKQYKFTFNLNESNQTKILTR